MNIILQCVITLALLFIAITMFARANDLRLRQGWHWIVRLLSFIGTTVCAVGIIAHMWRAEWMIVQFYAAGFVVSLSGVFFTTPYLPPYWKWLTKDIFGEPINSDDRRLPK